MEKMVEEVLRHKPENLVKKKIILAWIHDSISLKWLIEWDQELRGKSKVA